MDGYCPWFPALNAGSGNVLRQGGRVPVRPGPGAPKLLHQSRTVFPSLLSNKRVRFVREATGKQTISGSVRQLPPSARIEPERWGRTMCGLAVNALTDCQTIKKIAGRSKMVRCKEAKKSRARGVFN